MTILIYNLKRIFSQKSNFFTMLALPVAFITMIVVLNSGGGSQFKIGITDQDQTTFSQILVDSLKERGEVIFIEEDEMQSNLINANINYGIVIPKGFTDQIIGQDDAKLRGYELTESDGAVSTIFFVESFLNSAKHIAKAAEGNEQKFYAGIELYQQGFLISESKTIENSTQPRELTLGSMGFLIMGMLFFSATVANTILKDKENKTYYRIFVSPLKMKSYTMQNLLSFLMVSLTQVFLILALMHFVFKLNLGPSVLNIIILLIIFSILSVSFGIALTSLAKDSRQANVISTLLVTPMIMLGGGFWPRYFMPNFLQQIGNLVPVTWMLKSVEKILYGQPITAASTELFIMFLFITVFFLMGAWKKADISA